MIDQEEAIETVDEEESAPLTHRDAVREDSCKDRPARKDRRLGFALILVVVVIWVASSFLVQSIERQFAAPFFLTSVCTSLFTILLPISCLSGSLQRVVSNDKFRALESPEADLQRLSLREIILGSVVLAPFWFLANFLYNVSLQYTSVTSSTILSGTSAIFTLVLGALFRLEKVTWFKSFGVAICMLGTICVGLSDRRSEKGSGTFLGDLGSLFSAFFYAVYSLLIERQFPGGDESVDMALVFGFVGAMSFFILLPVVVALHVTEIEDLSGLTGTIMAWIIVKGLSDNVLSDYLWGRAVLLTSPTVTTVGLSLTIPLSTICDVIITGKSPGGITMLGAILVTLGFIAVSMK